MLRRQLALFSLAALVCAALLLLTIAPAPVQAAGANLDKFAKCLADKKVTMYGTFWCSHCQDQKDLFGASFQYVNYVECGVKGSRQIADQCKALGLKRTPTWIFPDGERLEGTTPLEKLSEKSGCPLQ